MRTLSKLLDLPLNQLRKSKKSRTQYSVGPSLFWYAFFFVIPTGYMFIISFWRQSGIRLIPDLTLGNYFEFFVNPVYYGVFLKSLLIAVSVTLLSVGFGYAVAYYMATRIKKYKIPTLLLLLGPFWANYLLIIFAWKAILGKTGILNSFLQYLGLIEEPVGSLLYSPLAVVITLVHIWTPFLVLPMFTSLEKIDQTLLEAAEDLGANKRQAFARVTLPLSMPGIMVAVLFVFIPTVGEFITPLLVGGPAGQMYGNLIQVLFHRGFDWPLGSALTFIMFMVTVAAASILILKIGLQKVIESL